MLRGEGYRWQSQPTSAFRASFNSRCLSPIFLNGEYYSTAEAEVPIVGNWRRLLGQSANPVPAVFDSASHHRCDGIDCRHFLIKTSIIIPKLERASFRNNKYFRGRYHSPVSRNLALVQQISKRRGKRRFFRAAHRMVQRNRKKITQS